MNYTDEAVANACRLGPVEAARLLDEGRKGDLSALGLWAVRAVHHRMVRMGASPAQALYHTRQMLSGITLTPVLRG